MSHQPLSLEPSFLDMGSGFSTQQKPSKPPSKNSAVPPFLPSSLSSSPQTQNMHSNMQPPSAGSSAGTGIETGTGPGTRSGSAHGHGHGHGNGSGPALGLHDWIPPPAQLATVNSDAIDLNDEVFFNYNSAPSYTTDPFSLGGDIADLAAHASSSSSSSSMANFDYNYTAALQAPMKYTSPFDMHYSHRRRFSSAVEQLNRMSLRAHSSSKSPSPDLYGVLAEPQVSTEERTVNPRYLLGGNAPGTTGQVVASSSHRGSTTESQEFFASNGRQENTFARTATRYILPSSVSSPSLTTFFSKQNSIHEIQESVEPISETVQAGQKSEQGHAQALSLEANQRGNASASSNPSSAASALNTPLNPYVMNDECVSAITYWLNNTADVITEKPAPSIARTPTSVSKPGWARRNSIQVVSPRTEDGSTKAMRTLSIDQKRRRRKSVNNSSIPEVSLPTGLSLSMSQAQLHTQSQTQAQFLHLLQKGGQDRASLSITPKSLTLNSSSRQEDKHDEAFEAAAFDALNVAVPDRGHNFKANFPSEEVAIDSNIMEIDAKQNQDSTLPVASTSGPDAGDDEPKPFPCPDCEKQFKRSEHLKRHIRSVHSNIRPFHCKYCEKKFSRSDNLAQHSKTHFKVNANGTTTVIYGNPNPKSRGDGGRKKSTDDVDMEEFSRLKEEE